jgi:hypothetical protein
MDCLLCDIPRFLPSSGCLPVSFATTMTTQNADLQSTNRNNTKNKPQLYTANNLSCDCLPALIPHPEIAHLIPDSSLKIPSLNNRVLDDT